MEDIIRIAERRLINRAQIMQGVLDNLVAAEHSSTRRQLVEQLEIHMREIQHQASFIEGYEMSNS